MSESETAPQDELDAVEREYAEWSAADSVVSEEHTVHSAKALEQLLAISGEMHRIHERDELLTYVSERLRDFFDAQNSFVILFDDAGQPQILKSNVEDGVAPLLSSTIIEKVRNSTEPIVISDTSLDPDLNQRTSIEFLKIASIMCAPLIIEDQVIGALQFDHRDETNGFPSSDARLLQLFANQIATAVYNLQLIEGRNEALAQSRIAQNQASKSERLAVIGRLAAGVAHDFNNTLFITLGQCDAALARGGLTEELKSSLIRIQSCALDAAKTVGRLQSLGPGMPRSSRAEILDLNSLLNDVAAATRIKWQEEPRQRGLTVKLILVWGDAPLVKADPSEIREILTNLVFNSVEAMPEGGSIRLETGGGDGCAFVSVSDNGKGMTAEQCSRAFEPFFSSKAGRGHGFGLSTCWSLAEGMGATLRVESVPSKGTEFTLRIPEADEHAVLPEAMRRKNIGDQPRDISCRKLDILVVEDDSDVLVTLEQMLTSTGHRVACCGSAREALERLDSEVFELVVTDMTMPEMTGAEMAANLHTRMPNLPVVLISGYGARIGSALTPNVQQVLAKPISLGDLTEALSEVIFPPR